MGLTSFFIGCGLAFFLQIFLAQTKDPFEIDCYRDCGFGDPELRLAIFNCTRRALDSLQELSTWITEHKPFIKLLANPNLNLSIRYDYNNIKAVAPFPFLPRTTLLSLSHNQIHTISNGAFTNLTDLYELDLSHNLITGETLRPAVFSGKLNKEQFNPSPIRILNLSGNQIHSLNRNTFQHLQSLERLDLYNNPIKIIDQTTQLAISTLSRLRWLDLGDTQLKKLPADMLIHTPLETLNLNMNKFEKVPKELAELQRTLTTLNLNGNLMMAVDAGDFGALENLVELQMSGLSRLRKIESGAFSRLKSLKKFVCSYNPSLTDIGTQLFHHAPNEVVLRNNTLSTLAKDATQWDEISILDVQSNPWNCDCQIEWLVFLLSVRSYIDPDFYMDVNIFQDFMTSTLIRRCSGPDWLRGYRLDSLAEHFRSACQHTPASGLAASTSPASKTNLQITFCLVTIFIVAAVFLFLIRSGRISFRTLRFLKKDRVKTNRLKTNMVVSTIKYQKAEQSEKNCEMVEMKRNYSIANCV